MGGGEVTEETVKLEKSLFEEGIWAFNGALKDIEIPRPTKEDESFTDYKLYITAKKNGEYLYSDVEIALSAEEVVLNFISGEKSVMIIGGYDQQWDVLVSLGAINPYFISVDDDDYDFDSKTVSLLVIGADVADEITVRIAKNKS